MTTHLKALLAAFTLALITASSSARAEPPQQDAPEAETELKVRKTSPAWHYPQVFT